MTKAQLLKELQTNIYVMLKPSPIEGIGVFAIRDIPTGCREMFSAPGTNDKWISLTLAEVEELPSHSKFLVENYCLYDDTHYFIPGHGFKKNDLALYLNHSDTPNIISINDGAYFETIKDIISGEELVINYGEICNS